MILERETTGGDAIIMIEPDSGVYGSFYDRKRSRHPFQVARPCSHTSINPNVLIVVEIQ